MQQVLFTDLIFLAYFSLDTYLVYQTRYQKRKAKEMKKEKLIETPSLNKKKKESDNDDTDEHISAA